MSYTFGPLERIVAINFPNPIKVYWLWKQGGHFNLAKFPGNNVWATKFGPSNITYTPAPWQSSYNMFLVSRNAMGKDFTSWVGIDAQTGVSTPATPLRYFVQLDGQTIDERASLTYGGFFLKKQDAINFANNIFGKGMEFSDYVSKRSHPQNIGYRVAWAPGLFETYYPDGRVTAVAHLLCDTSPPLYDPNGEGGPPFAVWDTIQVWETDWPDTTGTGPINNTQPPAVYTLQKVSANTDTQEQTSEGYIIMVGNQQVTDLIIDLKTAQDILRNLQSDEETRSRLFTPHDGFPNGFTLNPKLVATITYTGGGQNDKTYKSPQSTFPHYCTWPASISPVGGYANVVDSCGNKVATNLGIGIGGTANAGFRGPVGFDYQNPTVV